MWGIKVIPINEIINALKVGEQLKYPAKWKNRQATTNLVGALIASILVVLRWWRPDLVIPDEVSDFIVEGIGGVLVLVNYYLIKATSSKVGFKGQRGRNAT